MTSLQPRGVKSGRVFSDDNRSPYRTLSLDQEYAGAQHGAGSVHRYPGGSQVNLGMPATQLGGVARAGTPQALPLGWIHDRYARALAQTARLQHPGASREQIKDGVGRALRVNSASIPSVPAEIIGPLVEKVVDKHRPVDQKIAAVATEVLSQSPKQSAINVARQVLRRLVQGRMQFEASSRAATGQGGGNRAAPTGAPGKPKGKQGKGQAGAQPALNLVVPPRAAGKGGGGEGNGKGGREKNKKKKNKKKEEEGGAAAPQRNSSAGTAAAGGKQGGGAKKKEAKEMKKQKQAAKAMQAEVSRLTRSPRLSFPERIAFPECDDEFLRSLGKKGGSHKNKKISLLPRLVDLLYHGGLHPGRRVANPVRLDDLRSGNPMHVLKFYSDGKSYRMKFILDFLSVNYYRLIRVGMSLETATEKVVIRDLIKIAAAQNAQVYEATQKILVSKVSGEYRRRTQDVDRDEAMPKVSIEGKVPDMHTETLMSVDNERFNAWLERNAYAFGFHHKLLKDFYFDEKDSMVEFVLQHMEKHEDILRWMDGKAEHVTKHYDLSRKLTLSMVKEMQLTLINSMFGTVYNMLADVLIAMHVPSHNVVLANFVNLFLRICTLGADDKDGFLSLAKDRKVFNGVLKAMLPTTEKEGARTAFTGDLAMQDAKATEAKILTHRIGASDFVSFLADKDFQAKGVAPERAQMYKHFIVDITDARVRERGRMEPFKPFVPKPRGEEPRTAEGVPGEYKQIAFRLFREYSAKFIETGIRKLTEELRTDAPLVNVLEHKHGYDGIVHRLGTLGGWIKSVGVEEANGVMGVPFLNEQGFVQWPLAEPGLELNGSARVDCAMFMRKRNMRMASLLALTPPAHTNSFAQPHGRYYPLEFSLTSFVSEMNKHADELRAKKAVVREHRQERKARSEAIVALLESRKAKRALAAEERKLAKLKKQEERQAAKEGEAGAQKGKKGKDKKKNKKEGKKAEVGVGPQVHAVLKILDEERRERRKEEEKMEAQQEKGASSLGKIEELSSSDEDEPADTATAPTAVVRVAPAPSEPEEDFAATSQMITESVDGKDGERASSPRNVEELLAKA